MDMFGRQHAAAHGIVHALDARHVHKARRATDQSTAGEAETRHRLIATFSDRARAIGKPLAAFQHGPNGRVHLDALELVERRQIRIVIIQVNYKTDRRRDSRHNDRRTGHHRCRSSEASQPRAEPGPSGALKDRSARLPSGRYRTLAAGCWRRAKISQRAAWSGCRAPPRRTACTCRTSSMPRVKDALCEPSLATPMSPVAIPRTAPLSSYSTSVAAKPG